MTKRLIRRGDKLVRIGNELTTNENCCCAICCNCDKIDCAWLLNIRLTVRLSGAFNGTCRIPAVPAPDVCARWATGAFGWQDCDSGTAPTDVCGYNLADVYFFCPEGSTSLFDLQFEATISNMGCNFLVESSDPPPRFGSVAKNPTEVSCEGDFYAKFVFPMYPTQPNGCNCSGQVDQVFEVFFDFDPCLDDVIPGVGESSSSSTSTSSSSTSSSQSESTSSSQSPSSASSVSSQSSSSPSSLSSPSSASSLSSQSSSSPSSASSVSSQSSSSPSSLSSLSSMSSSSPSSASSTSSSSPSSASSLSSTSSSSSPSSLSSLSSSSPSSLSSHSSSSPSSASSVSSLSSSSPSSTSSSSPSSLSSSSSQSPSSVSSLSSPSSMSSSSPSSMSSSSPSSASSLSSSSPSSASSLSSLSSTSSSSPSSMSSSSPSSMSSSSPSSMSSSSSSSSSSSAEFICCTAVPTELSIVIDNVTEDVAPPTTYGPCCVSLNGTWNIPFTEITDDYARYEETFDNFCETLELNVVALINQIIPENCQIYITFTVYDGMTAIFDMTFRRDITFNENCAAWNNIELIPDGFNGSATMSCIQGSLNCFVTAV